jgi:hypothetical protein
MTKRLLVLLLLFFSIAAYVAPSYPVPIETWMISADGRTASVTGRVKQPIWKKLNPVWWLLNDDEPDPPDWQLPGKPYLIRQLSWYSNARSNMEVISPEGSTCWAVTIPLNCNGRCIRLS